MPFSFSEICKLLSDLEKLKKKQPPLLPNDLKNNIRSKVTYWFKCNRSLIHAPDTNGVAFLSTLFPEKRTDRVYGLKEDRLCKLIGRCLRLNSTNRRILEDWRIPGRGDLGDRIESIQKIYDGEPKGFPVTVEEVDQALQTLASQSRFSGPDIRSSRTPLSSSSDEILSDIFCRLKSSEAKWLTRLILKDFSPVVVDQYMVLNEYHFLLPSLLKLQDSFTAAVALIRGPFMDIPSYTSDFLAERAFKRQAAKLLSPQIGVKVGRPQFLKARSMENCIKLANQQNCSVERKYDGEYCEIHVDLDKSLGSQLKIFSKSCKDSTADREKLHNVIRNCLRIGRPDCAFKRKCIVIGEMVVYSDKERRILEFYHIRKHVSRSGVFLGKDEDSQILPGEHLMIVLYDLLLVDDDLTLRRPYSQRREQLTNIMTKRNGYAITSERTTIDFSRPKEASEALCYQFAAALTFRTEGLVLKALDMPYFSLISDENGDPGSYIIKLKKDYLPEFEGQRDVADFAVIGASFDPKLAHKSNTGKVDYTTFHLGCLTNKEAALRFGQPPLFEIVGMITLDQCIPKAELRTLNDHGNFCAIPFVRGETGLRDAEDIGFDLRLDHNPCSKMNVIFTEPIVVEVLGSSFDRPPNKDYFMLRHPRILKVHLDRTWKDATCMEQLKKLANEARNAPDDGVSQEMSQNVKGIMDKFQRKFDRDRLQRSTPRSKAMTSPATTIRTTQSSNSDSPCIRRSRGSSGSKNKYPVLVRIDTAELLPGERHVAGISLNPRNLASKIATDSPPTPKSSGMELPVCSEMAQAQKSPRKRLSEETLDAYSRKKSALNDKIQPQEQPSRTLIDITNNKTTRIVNQSPPTTAPRCAPLIGKTSNPKTVHKDAPSACRWPDCPFANAVVYLSPCVRSQPWVADLLKSHSTERVQDLEHWLRDNIKQPSLGFMIAESAAWPSMQKIILVEPYREGPTRALVEQIRTLGLRDEVLFFDWRFLEKWGKFEADRKEIFCAQKFMAVAKTFLYGRTVWVEEEKKVSFFDKDSALIPRGWLLQ